MSINKEIDQLYLYCHVIIGFYNVVMLGAGSKWFLHRILSIDGNHIDSNFDDNVNKKLRLDCSLFLDCNFYDGLRNNHYMLLCIL